MTRTYLYRSGNGNDGDFAHHIIALDQSESPFAAIKALLANEYQTRTATRRHVMRHAESDGDSEYGVHVVVYEDREGVGSYNGGAWRTGTLEPLTDHDAEYYSDHGTRYAMDSEGTPWTLRALLDKPAYRWFKALNVSK